MPSLTHWLQRFVAEVRAPVPPSATAAVLDQSLAAAFVHLPAERPIADPAAIAGDPLFGPTPAIPPRRASNAPPWPSSAWPTPQRPTLSQTNPAWLTGAPARPAAPGFPSPTAPSPQPSSAGALAALASAFGSPRSSLRGTIPATPANAWPTATRPGPDSAGAALTPRVSTAPPDSLGHGPPAPLSADPGDSPPPDSPTPASAVIPLAELLRDLVPASPSEARLEALWQQRAGTFGNEPEGWPAAAGSIARFNPPAVDWNELARRLADLEAGQAG